MTKKKKKLIKSDHFSLEDMSKQEIDTILIEGTFYAPSGYSSATREFVHEYIKNYRDEYKNIYLIDRQWDNIRMVLPERFQDTIVKHTVQQTSDIKDVNPLKSMVIRWGLPTAFEYEGFADVPHRIKSIYFVWECNRLPALWTDLLSHYDIIFTSSNASKKAIETSVRERGWNIPVEIIPHGVGDHYHQIEDRENTLDGFTFLSVGTFSARKAPMEMIEAFLREFRDDSENVRMLWKVGNVNDASQMLILRREIQRMAFKLDLDLSISPRLILDMNTYDFSLMNEIYNEADCMVQVSHGEAWGLPILNGMATGTPSITLEKGGHRSYCTRDTTFFVKSNGLVYSHGKDDWYASHHAVQWNSIDMESYQRMLRYAYEHENEREEKAEQGLLIAKKFTWRNVVKKASKIFHKYNKIILPVHERT